MKKYTKGQTVFFCSWVDINFDCTPQIHDTHENRKKEVAGYLLFQYNPCKKVCSAKRFVPHSRSFVYLRSQYLNTHIRLFWMERKANYSRVLPCSSNIVGSKCELRSCASQRLPSKRHLCTLLCFGKSVLIRFNSWASPRDSTSTSTSSTTTTTTRRRRRRRWRWWWRRRRTLSSLQLPTTIPNTSWFFPPIGQPAALKWPLVASVGPATHPVAMTSKRIQVRPLLLRLDPFPRRIGTVETCFFLEILYSWLDFEMAICRISAQQKFGIHLKSLKQTNRL